MIFLDVSYSRILEIRRELNLPLHFEESEDGSISLFLITTCGIYRAEVVTEEERNDFQQRKQYMNKLIKVEPFTLITPNLLIQHEFTFSPSTSTRVNIEEYWLACNNLTSIPSITIDIYNGSHKRIVLPTNLRDCFFLAEGFESIELGFDMAFKFKFKLDCSLRVGNFLSVGVEKESIVSNREGVVYIIFKGGTVWDF